LCEYVSAREKLISVAVALTNANAPNDSANRRQSQQTRLGPRLSLWILAGEQSSLLMRTAMTGSVSLRERMKS